MTKEDLQKIGWAIRELEQIETQALREAVQLVIDALRSELLYQRGPQGEQ